MGANLPGNSRYAGTVNYTMMRQDAAFQLSPYGAAVYAAAPLPQSSLNGADYIRRREMRSPPGLRRS